MDTSVFVTQTQIEKIKGEAHVFACFYDGLFPSCLEDVDPRSCRNHSAPSISYKWKKYNICHCVHFFPIRLWCWVFEEQSGHNFLALRYKSVPVSAKVGHESKLQSKLNATALPPSPTLMRCSTAPTPFFFPFLMGVRGRYRVIRHGLLSDHQATLRFSFQMEVR